MIAALASVVLILYGGRRNSSGVLLILFVIWVLSPFVGLALANKMSVRWPAGAQTGLHVVMLIVAGASLAVYVNAVLISPPAKLAAPFLIVPLVSWLIILIVVLIAAMKKA
ncbi:MAG TPA: hypothetical protein VEK83_15435 [Gemmatimonadales bacterium]|nr:hypothetical protein [Gemmatimonadales bacterium]